MPNKTTDALAVTRVLELGTRCLNPDDFMSLESITEQIKVSVENRVNDEDPMLNESKTPITGAAVMKEK